jgi:hypothetical protein
MSIDRLGRDLEALGLTGRDLRCLLLLPQVYVGWAIERRELSAVEALLDTTARHTRFGPACLDLARGWLFERPTQAQFKSGFALLRALRSTHEARLVTRADVLQSVMWATRAVLIDRRMMQGARRRPIRLGVEQALMDVEAWLEIEPAYCWAGTLLATPDTSRRSNTARTRELRANSAIENRRPPQADTEDEYSSVSVVQDDFKDVAPFQLVRRIG